MKVKLAVSNERYEEIKEMLIERGIEIDDNSDLVLSESNRFLDSLTVKDITTNAVVPGLWCIICFGYYRTKK